MKVRILEAITVAIQRYNKPTHRQILDVLRELFPQETELAEQAKADEGWIAMIRVCVHEMETSSEEQVDERITPRPVQLLLDLLPGDRCSMVVAIPYPDGIDRVVPIHSLTRSDMQAYDKKLKKNIKAAVRREEDWQLKMDYLEPYQSKAETTLGQALQRIQAKHPPDIIGTDDAIH